MYINYVVISRELWASLVHNMHLITTICIFVIDLRQCVVCRPSC